MTNVTGPSDKNVIPAPVPSSVISKDRMGKGNKVNTAGNMFAGILDKARETQSELKVSAHARQRLEHRSIRFNENDWREISAAVDRAGDRGSRSSLLLYGDVALVASVSNRTIVTAIDGTDAREHIFTGIDSAVIVK